MPFAPFVPLRVLSSYSMLECAIDPKAIAKLAKERGFPAIAICDRNGLYGPSAFDSGCAEQGVQPIIGALLGVQRPVELEPRVRITDLAGRTDGVSALTGAGEGAIGRVLACGQETRAKALA